MLNIRTDPDGTIHLGGRLDAAEAPKADAALGALVESTTADLAELDYISSAGLGVLVKASMRLTNSGRTLKLINLNQRVRNILHYSGLDRILTLG